MRLILISDTHSRHDGLKIPECDVLVFAGDMCNVFLASHYTAYDQIRSFGNFMRLVPAKRKVVIAGNHDLLFEKDLGQALECLGPGIDYLQDSGIEIDGIHFWGSPWQPEFALAFNLKRGPAIKEKWDLIPSNTDVLITHGPPLGRQDKTYGGGGGAGCGNLRDAVRRIHPLLHVFGHIHEAYGVTETDQTVFVNASLVNYDYQITKSPVQIDLDVPNKVIKDIKIL